MSRAALVLAGLLVLVSSVQGLELKRVAISPFGPSYIESLTLTDSDHDGLGELVYRTGSTRPADPLRWEIAEYRPVNRLEVVKSDTGTPYYPCSLVTGNLYPYSSGDVDRDGRTDLVGEIRFLDTATNEGRVVVCTIESPDSVSYPSVLNWFALDTCNPGSGHVPRYITDLDSDSALEITFASWYGTSIFENVANDRESLVWYGEPGAPHVFGDFDQNGKREFVSWWLDQVRVAERVGDNQFAVVCTLDPSYHNPYDFWTGSDVDQNGRPEFFMAFERRQVRYYVDVCMFEALSEHNYVLYPVFAAVLQLGTNLSGIGSTCADLDGDKVEEVIWSRGYDISILKATGPHQFDSVFHWVNDHGSHYESYCNAADFNGNRYNELYVSGDNKTSVFEVEAIRVLHPDTLAAVNRGDTCEIRWRVYTPPRCDSVSLFLKTDTVVPNGERFWRLDTIATGLAPTESSYAWVVPDTQLAWAKVLAIAYGPGWQFDESDSAFSIGPVGIAAGGPLPPKEWTFSVSPNPASGRAMVGYDVPEASDVTLCLYDAAGRKLAVLAAGRHEAGRYSIPFGPCILSSGVYFLRLEAPAARLSRKVTASAGD